jgi:hypothetical protein
MIRRFQGFRVTPKGRASRSSGMKQVALRTAKAEGLIAVERTGRHNTITLSAKWKAWLDGPR